ncbi:MAG: AmmeMemoRadiSam system protein B [Candidatus Omnitrophica bacterium]|nr:AmmeMemoRadiSam system protein B [Candidatus Omnitrophota bacterium]
MIRKPAVAGQFYPADQKSLLKELDSLIDKGGETKDLLAVISPHAGYMYSGRVAGRVLSVMKPKPVYIIMGPNHTGMGLPFSLSDSDAWSTPLGEVRIDRRLADLICKNSKFIKRDSLAHMYEHSIEVQLPFLQVLQKDFTFVPIVISHADADTYANIGKELASFIKELGLEKETAFIASSDMTHYEPQETAKGKDAEALKAIERLDESMLVKKIESLNITMCGYGPVSIAIAAAKELGAKEARLISYETSAETTGDSSSVVGYAGVAIL